MPYTIKQARNTDYYKNVQDADEHKLLKSLEEEKGSVEIDERNFTPDDREPEFKNKIEESIYRLKKNK